MKKNILSIALVISLMIGWLPAIDAPANAAESISDSTIESRINELDNILNGKYFTVSHTAEGCGKKSSRHGCSNCEIEKIMEAQWFKDTFGNVTKSQLPILTTGQQSCMGFVNFAEWYIFRAENNDKVTRYYSSSQMNFNYKNVSENVHMGDYLRLDKRHSVIFISCDASGITVLDSNYNGSYNCMVAKHTISYAKVNKFTVSKFKGSAGNPVESKPNTPSTYFTIRNLGSGKMLNVKGSSSKSNSNVTIYQADGTTGQNFQLIADPSGGYVINPQCAPTCALNVYGQSSNDGLNVNIWTKSGHSTQAWFIEYNSSLSGYVIRSANDKNYVLAASGYGNSSNVQLAQFDPTNTYQVWTSEAFSAISAPTISEPSNLAPTPPPSESNPSESTENTGSPITPQTGSYFTIKNLGSDKMLNVKGNSDKSNTNVIIYQADGTTGQNFQFLADGNGYYVLQPQCAPSCALNVYGQYAAAGFNVNIWTKSGNSTQSWIIEYTSAWDGYLIRSVDNPNYVLTASGSGNSSNVELQQYDAGNAYQVWTSAAFSAATPPTSLAPDNPSNNEPTNNTVSVRLDSYFTIKNLGSDKMLNVKGNSSKSNTNVTVYQADGTTGQNFQFIDNGAGGYVIEPQCAPSCAINVYGQYSADGFNVNTWTKSGNSTQSWIIEYNKNLGGFVIRSADNKDYVLTAAGSGNASNVQLGKYDPANSYQVWTSDAFQY